MFKFAIGKQLLDERLNPVVILDHLSDVTNPSYRVAYANPSVGWEIDSWPKDYVEKFTEYTGQYDWSDLIS